ncbi:MAG TPA: ABC transporter substrate-binding protein [Stellaceae bacterium]|nr:ABC transporter substrate-binding protein [Stellaceae bacterium]
MRVRNRALTVLAAAALALSAAAASGAEPLTVRAGWVVAPATMTPILFANKSILRHYGVTYVVEPIHFGSTSPEITALATGDLDIASLAFSSFGAAVLNGHMEDLRVVADGFQDGVEGHYSGDYLVLKDSPVRTIEDLMGKTVASNGIGGATDMGIRALLRQRGMEDKRDYTVVEAQFPSMRAMLEERKVDLVGVVPPFAYDPRLKETARVLFHMRDGLGTTQMIVLAARTGFLEQNRAALYDFFEDLVRALHWYLDPAHREEAIGIVAGFTKQPRRIFAEYLFTGADYYRDPDARPNLEALQRNLDVQQQLGFLPGPLDVRAHADLSFIEEAAKRLK